MLTRTVADVRRIAAVSPEAHAVGIREGFTLAQARALCAHVVHADHEPDRDRRALEALGRWMMRFTPVVAVAENGQTGPADPSQESHLPPALLLDVTGCERAMGGMERILSRLRQALEAMRIGAAIAIGPTVGAAWAIAYGQSRISDFGSRISNLKSRISHLPPVALRLDAKLARTLHHLGIETIGQLLKLPREQLPSRFGPTLLLRIDQLFGRIDEPLVPLQYHAPVLAEMEFDGVVSDMEALWAVFQNLIQQIIGQLARRCCGARRMEVSLLRPRGEPVQKSIFLSRPSRNAANLFNLFRCALETLELRPRDDGFVGMRLAVPVFQPMPGEQIALLGQAEHDGRVELDGLVERLRVRLGDSVLMQAQLVEAHVPEKGYAEGTEARRQEGTKWRPLPLLSRPVEARVMVSPSDDRDGRPVAFTCGGELHRLIHTVGPERIAGRWWEGNDKTRDYFDVEDDRGRRFWLFRVMQTARWYVHGVFE
mgnify:FL=1